MIVTTRFSNIPPGATVRITATQGTRTDTLGPFLWRVAPMPGMASTPGGVTIMSAGADPGPVTLTTTPGGVRIA